MLLDNWGALPERVRIAPLEHPTSFESRLRDANHYTPRAWNTLVNEMMRGADGLTRNRLLEQLGGLRPGQFDHYDTHTSHSDGSSCSQCLVGLSSRYACIRCTKGAAALQVQHDGPRVCPQHMRWIAVESTEQQCTVGADVLRADRRYQRLRRAGLLDSRRLAELLGCVEAWATAHQLQHGAPARFAIAVNIAQALQAQPDRDGNSSATDRYGALAAAVTAVAGDQSAVLTDSIWLLLRADRLNAETSPHRFASTAGTSGDESGELDVLSTNFYPRVHHLQLSQLVNSPAPGTRFTQAARLDDDNDYVCPRGHRFSATGRVLLASRASGGCGYCARKKVAPGSSLSDTHPALATQWHPTANGLVKPTDIFSGTGQSYFWLCPQGHTYPATPNSRTSKGTGCGYCANVRVDRTNSLRSTHPHLESEWNLELNGGLTPGDVVAGSEREAWWNCPDGHTYEAPIDSRAAGSRCRVCTHQIVHPSTSLASTHPDVAARWAHEENGGRTPEQVFAGSNDKVWWRCDNGCLYDQAISSAAKGVGCRFCSNRSTTKKNCMRTARPDLAAEFHPTKNGDYTPDNLVAGTSRPLWWLCSLGHDWEVSGDNRVRQRTGCPYCSNKKVWAGFNDMATTRPDLAAEFHKTKNGALKPTDVVAGTGKRIWWECGHGHEWPATGDSRANRGRGCKECTKASACTPVP